MKKMMNTAIAAMLAATLVGCKSTASSASVKEDSAVKEDNPIVEVTGGKVKGLTDENGVTAYKGIPYAASAAGENRFRDPQPVEPWSDVKDCTDFGPIVVQTPVYEPFMPWTGEYLDLGYDLENGKMSEDSLNLNVWTSSEEGDKDPVIVYIHGGANTTGSGQNEIYRGQYIAQKDVVYVSINYRVGLYGFLSYTDKNGEEAEGNYAAKDQIAALTWVQDNIEKFGGDPSNVTIMGQSAGSINVQTLIASPKAAGLFKRAVALSANAYAGRAPKAKADAQAEAAEALKDYTLEDLRKMSLEDLEAIRAEFNPNSAVIDGVTVTQSLAEAYASGNFNHVDLIQGCVTGDTSSHGGFIRKSEGEIETAADFEEAAKEIFADKAEDFLKLYAVTDETVADVVAEVNFDKSNAEYSFTLAQKNSNDAENKSFQHCFTRPVPDKNKENQELYGAFHTGDVGYWTNYFSNTSERPWEKVDYELGDKMSSYLVNFAKTGDPNGNGLPEWKEAGKDYSYNQLGEEVKMVSMDADKAEFWNDYFTALYK